MSSSDSEQAPAVVVVKPSVWYRGLPILAGPTTTTSTRLDVGAVVIVDVQMPFVSMIGFMVKLAIGAIPAGIILAIIAALFSAIMGGFSQLCSITEQRN